MRYTLKIITVLIFGSLYWQSANAQTFTDRELKVKTYRVNPGVTIEVNNKYGKIHVTPWRKDSIRFEVEILLSSNSVSKISKLKKGIDIDFTSTGYYISAVSDFGGSGNQFMNELRNLSESLIPGKNSIEVNYRIYCPESINLNLINKFGDIYLDDLRGEINISLSNGDMKINSISGESRIELSFGSANINHLSDATIMASYADLDVSKAEKIKIISKSSTINIDDADVLRVDTRRDKYFIGMIWNANITSNFSEVWVEDLYCELIAEMKFGDLTIDKVSRDFCKIDILSEYADLNLFMERDAAYSADIYSNKDAIVNLPVNVPSPGIKSIPRNEDETHSYYRTSAEKGVPTLTVRAPNKCYINIKEK